MINVYMLIVLVVLLHKCSSDKGQLHVFGFWHLAHGSPLPIRVCATMAGAVLRHYKFHLLTRLNQHGIKELKYAQGKADVAHCFKKLYAYAEVVKLLPDSDYVLYIDLTDVIFQADATTLLRGFHNVVHTTSRFKINKVDSSDTSGTVLFNAEANCYPYFLQQAPSPASPNKSVCDFERELRSNSSAPYLNSGVFIGRAKDVSILLNYQVN